MKNDDDIVIGAAVLLLLLGRSERVTVPWGDLARWTVPVPDMRVTSSGLVYPAVVSQEWRAAGPGVAGHYGVDLMYMRRVIGDQPSYAPGTHDGTAKYFAPAGTPIVAARSGTLWSADRSARGFEVVLDHGKPFATYYQHLDRLAVPLAKSGKTDAGAVYSVNAGDVIGFMGYDPTDPEGLRHLHFAVWYNGAGDSASVDPAPVIGKWQRATWSV